MSPPGAETAPARPSGAITKSSCPLGRDLVIGRSGAKAGRKIKGLDFVLVLKGFKANGGFTHLNSTGLVFGYHFFGKSFAPIDFEKPLRILFTVSCFLELFCVGATEAYESDGFTHLNSPGLVFGYHCF